MLKLTIATISDIEELDKVNQIGKTSWKVEFFDFMEPSYIAICSDQSKLIGTEGYIGYKLINNCKLVQTHRSERTVINPNYRGQGIFEKLVNTCDIAASKDNSLFAWGATSALKPFGKAGFDGYTGFRNYIFFPIAANRFRKLFSLNKLSFLNPLRIYKILKSKNLPEIKSLISWISLIKPTSIKKSETITFTDFNYIEVQELIFHNDVSFYKINPTDLFFDWLVKKGLSYEKLLIKENQTVIGYIILKIDKRKNYCTIVDIYFKSYLLNISQILSSLSKKEPFDSFDSFFLALNNSNNVHQKWIDTFKKSRIINLKKAGSFVIKNLKSEVSIEELLLTDLWLEL